MDINKEVGIVIIGRNEGHRLHKCLESIIKHTRNIVYVDSGSTDDSVSFAKSLDCLIVELDSNIPFTAGRARNEGFTKLLECLPDITYTQFIDGDCILNPDWIYSAKSFLDDNKDIAIVCGRREEIDINASIYNALCDIEWDTPIGNTRSCGGDFMVKNQIFRLVEGFHSSLIAGEEPELCFRIRSKGYKIFRMNKAMTKHDANMMSFQQWWQRTVRSGHAYAEGAYMHAKSPEKFNLKPCLSALFWSFILPIILVFGVLTNKFILFGLFLYPIQMYKIMKRHKHLDKVKEYVFLLLVGKFAEIKGILYFFWKLLNKQKNQIIEYK